MANKKSSSARNSCLTTILTILFSSLMGILGLFAGYVFWEIDCEKKLAEYKQAKIEREIKALERGVSQGNNTIPINFIVLPRIHPLPNSYRDTKMYRIGL